MPAITSSGNVEIVSQGDIVLRSIQQSDPPPFNPPVQTVVADGSITLTAAGSILDQSTPRPEPDLQSNGGPIVLEAANGVGAFAANGTIEVSTNDLTVRVSITANGNAVLVATGNITKSGPGQVTANNLGLGQVVVWEQALTPSRLRRTVSLSIQRPTIWY